MRAMLVAIVARIRAIVLDPRHPRRPLRRLFWFESN
jgi:hypothetical protein